MVIELIGGIGAGKSRVLSVLREEYGAEVIQTDKVAKELERKGAEGYRAIVGAFGPRVIGNDGELDAARVAEIIFADEEALARINALIHPLVWEEVYRRVRAFRACSRADELREAGRLKAGEEAGRAEAECGSPACGKSIELREAGRLNAGQEEGRAEAECGSPVSGRAGELREVGRLSAGREMDRAAAECGSPACGRADELREVGRLNAGRETDRAAAGRPPLLVVETALPEGREKAGDIYDEVWYVYTLQEVRIERLMAGRGYSREKCRTVMERQPSDEEYRALADRVIDNNGDGRALRARLAELLREAET